MNQANAGAKVLPLDRERYRYKMKDLADATGLDRQGIHFYIQQGLVPEGYKTSRNMGWYSEAHVERMKAEACCLQHVPAPVGLGVVARMRVLDGHAMRLRDLRRRGELHRRAAGQRDARAVERDAVAGVEVDEARARALVGERDGTAARQRPLRRDGDRTVHAARAG